MALAGDACGRGVLVLVLVLTEVDATEEGAGVCEGIYAEHLIDNLYHK